MIWGHLRKALQGFVRYGDDPYSEVRRAKEKFMAEKQDLKAPPDGGDELDLFDDLIQTAEELTFEGDKPEDCKP